MHPRQHASRPIPLSRWPNTVTIHARADGVIVSANRTARALLHDLVRTGVPLAAVLVQIGWATEGSPEGTASAQILRWQAGGAPYLARLDTLYVQGASYHRLMLMELPMNFDAANPHWTVLGQLAAAAAHEIRNPLTTVHGFLQMLQSETPPGIGQEHLAIVLREIDRVTELVSDFLTVSKPQAAERAPVDVASIAGEVLEASSRLFANRNQTCSLATGGPAPLVLGNRLQLYQLILNLVRNASDAAPSGGTVRVEVMTTPERRVYLRVQDDGPGFPPEFAERVFEPFFTTKDTGTGLGLMICRQIVEAHGGRLTIESPSSGASLLCSLPAKSQDAEA